MGKNEPVAPPTRFVSLAGMVLCAETREEVWAGTLLSLDTGFHLVHFLLWLLC